MPKEYARMHNYPAGAEVQQTSGHVKKKTHDGTWISRGRWMAAAKILKRDLEPGEKVYHRDGNPANDDPSNLAVIRFNAAQYRIKRSRVVWLPDLPARAKPYVPKSPELVGAKGG